MAYKLIGQNFDPVDVSAKVTGRAKYSEDIRMDGMVFAKLLSSPVPHAKISKIDVSAALKMPSERGIPWEQPILWRTAEQCEKSTENQPDCLRPLPGLRPSDRGLPYHPLHKAVDVIAKQDLPKLLEEQVVISRFLEEQVDLPSGLRGAVHRVTRGEYLGEVRGSQKFVSLVSIHSLDRVPLFLPAFIKHLVTSEVCRK